MPLQRRLPKRGFNSLTEDAVAEVRLGAIDKLGIDNVDLDALKKAGVVPRRALGAKVILSGKITRAVRLQGIKVTKGARAAIEAAGGNVEG